LISFEKDFLYRPNRGHDDKKNNEKNEELLKIHQNPYIKIFKDGL